MPRRLIVFGCLLRITLHRTLPEQDPHRSTSSHLLWVWLPSKGGAALGPRRRSMPLTLLVVPTRGWRASQQALFMRGRTLVPVGKGESGLFSRTSSPCLEGCSWGSGSFCRACNIPSILDNDSSLVHLHRRTCRLVSKASPSPG